MLACGAMEAVPPFACKTSSSTRSAERSTFGERLTVTRWRWRRVVAGVPNPIKVQTPMRTFGGPPLASMRGRYPRDGGRLVPVHRERGPRPSLTHRAESTSSELCTEHTPPVASGVPNPSSGDSPVRPCLPGPPTQGIATVNLTEAWGWAPDAGLSLSSPMGFAPSATRLGSLLLVRASVLSLVADGTPLTGNLGWTQSGGDPGNCGTTAGNTAAFP